MHYSEVYQSHSIPAELATWIAGMPKVELHVHLEGATSAELYYQMAKRNHHSLPAASLEEWRKFYDFRDFPHFIEVYLLSVQAIQTPDDFLVMMDSFLENQARLNVRYTEVFLSGSLYFGKFASADILSALAEGLKTGQARHGVRAVLIPDMGRPDALRPGSQEYVLEMALQARDLGIGVGMGIGGIEQGYPPRLYREVFGEARRQGLRVVGHGGEADGAQSVRGVLEDLHVERIGHGIRCLEDEDLVQTLKDRQVPIEVSPLSNYCTQVIPRNEPHPIRRMVDRGLYCTVNSDDPAMFSTDLNNEYLTLAAQGFSQAELWQLNLNGVNAAFLSDEERQGLLALWTQHSGR